MSKFEVKKDLGQALETALKHRIFIPTKTQQHFNAFIALTSSIAPIFSRPLLFF